MESASTDATSTPDPNRPQGAPIPGSFMSYVKSMGPGIVLVLTWLGAGDIVSAATSGGNYGYALMWVFVLCLLFRYVFVSIVAKYQLCNQTGISILGGLSRVHRLYPPFILICAVLVGHSVETYLLTGASAALGRLTGIENTKLWALLLCLIAFYITFKPTYRRIEKVFFVLAAILTVAFLGLAVWSQPSATGILRGVFAFALPPTVGRYDASFVMLSIVGAIAGGLANLMYPYFIREKGWLTPRHRKVQQYDLIFGIVILIILDLSVWAVGAEILHPRGIRVVDINSLALLLGEVLGRLGSTLFYVGLFAALFSNMIGTATAYAFLSADAYFHSLNPDRRRPESEYRHGTFYKGLVIWLIFSPLLWIALGRGEFVALTLLVNASQTVLIPLIVIGVWIVTAKAKHIGQAYKNRWWENLSVALLFLFGSVSAVLVAVKVLEGLGLLAGAPN